MRFRQIGAKFVLHYDQLNFDFGDQEKGLHLLFGPNEAGKSTLLKLITDLLFGGQIVDGVRDYYNTRSRIHGTLVRAEGNELSLERKKNYNRLVLTENSSPGISEEDLAQLLGGYNRERFGLMFAFDHHHLRSGGESLLRSDGHVGISLFEAGGGIQNLQNIFEQLSDRSEKLLDPSFRSGSAKAINRAWRGHQDAEKAMRAGSLRGEEWMGMRDRITDQRREIQRVSEEMQICQIQQIKLQRIKRIQNLLAELHLLRQQIGDMGDTPILNEESSLEIPQLAAARKSLFDELEKLRNEQNERTVMMENIHLDPPALDSAAEIEEISEELALYTAHKADLPSLGERLTAQQRDANDILKALALNISLDDVDQLRIPVFVEEKITRLVEQIAGINGEIIGEQEQLSKTDKEIALLEDSLTKLGVAKDVSALKKLIAIVRDQGNLEDDLAHTAETIRDKETKALCVLKKQAVWSGPLESVRDLQIPLQRTVDLFFSDWAAETQNLNDCRRELRDAEQKLSATTEELEKLELAGHVPVESELLAARERRDLGWSLVKGVWLDQPDQHTADIRAYAGTHQLADAYEMSVAEADDISDTMLRAADRLAQRSVLLQQQEQQQRSILSINQRRQALEERFASLQASWEQAWQPCGITPRTPGEMKEWLSDYYQPLLLAADEVAALKRQREALTGQISSFKQQAYRELDNVQSHPSQDITLKQLLAHCDQLVNNADLQEATRAALLEQKGNRSQEAANHRDAIKKKEAALKNLSAQWDELCLQYPELPKQPGAATVYLRELGKLFAGHTEIHALQSAIAEKQQRCQVFELKVAAMNRRLQAEDAAHLPSGVREARGRLAAAREADSSFKQAQKELLLVEAKIKTAEKQLADREAKLKALQIKWRCQDQNMLIELVERSNRYKALRLKYEEMARAVVHAGDGLSLEKLESELALVGNLDELPGQLDQLAERIVDLNKERDSDKERLFEATTNFNQLDGTKFDAAYQSQQSEQYLAEVDRNWHEYLRLELARRLLKRTIEEYREQNQATIISEAADFFRRLTLEKYPELTVEYEGTTPYLEALSESGARRRVHQMSEGTRDQLFLALRLAFLKQHLRASEPLPLIMDDILVNFDDRRTEAALEVLHELASDTQILYFTHHQSVLDSIRRVCGPERVLIQNMM